MCQSGDTCWRITTITRSLTQSTSHMWFRSGSHLQPINRPRAYTILLQNLLNVIARRDMLSN